jgi:hypothetical protein
MLCGRVIRAFHAFHDADLKHRPCRSDVGRIGPVVYERAHLASEFLTIRLGCRTARRLSRSRRNGRAAENCAENKPRENAHGNIHLILLSHFELKLAVNGKPTLTSIKASAFEVDQIVNADAWIASMKVALPKLLLWVPWIVLLSFVVWFAISLILAESGYDTLRWS